MLRQTTCRATPFARTQAPGARRGLTLLELLLALSLSALLFFAISMAVRLNLLTLDSQRTNVEEAQLARAILRMIADDLRSSIEYEEPDMSAVEGLLEESLGDAAALLGEGLPDEGGGEVPDEMEEDFASEEALLSGQTAANEELVEATELPPEPGLYGNMNQLQIDISRMPRVDEFQTPMVPEEMGGIVELPSAVKTVTYYLDPGGNPTSGPSGFQTGNVYGPQAAEDTVGGLVRRELDRSVTQWAISMGNVEGLRRSGDLVASEVVGLEFLYFDGYQWLPAWDSAELGGLPVAVQITIILAPNAGKLAVRDTDLLEASAETAETGGIAYRLVVPLPTAEPRLLEEEEVTDPNLEALGL